MHSHLHFLWSTALTLHNQLIAIDVKKRLFPFHLYFCRVTSFSPNTHFKSLELAKLICMLFMLHSDQEPDHLFNIQGQYERRTNCFAYTTLVHKRKIRFDFFVCVFSLKQSVLI